MTDMLTVIISYLQMAMYLFLWVCVSVHMSMHICACVCLCVHVHACVYNYGSLSAERETFLFGKAICWNRPAPFILNIITMQGKTKRKNGIQERKKGRGGYKWHSTAWESMSRTTFQCKIDNSTWSKPGREWRWECIRQTSVMNNRSSSDLAD